MKYGHALGPILSRKTISTETLQGLRKISKIITLCLQQDAELPERAMERDYPLVI
jgi:hypothetical protein